MTMHEDLLDVTDAELQAELNDLARLGVIRGWSRAGGRYIVGWHEVDPEPDDPAPQAVMTSPQCKAFVLGVRAGMGWVGKVAREVGAEQAAVAP